MRWDKWTYGTEARTHLIDSAWIRLAPGKERRRSGTDFTLRIEGVAKHYAKMLSEDMQFDALSRKKIKQSQLGLNNE
jgi:hypothetical protein